MQLFVHTCEFQVEKGMLCYLKIQLCGFRLVLIIKTNLPLGGRVKLSGCKRINRQWSQGGTFWKIKINKPQSHCTDCWSSVSTAIKFRKIPVKNLWEPLVYSACIASARIISTHPCNSLDFSACFAKALKSSLQRWWLDLGTLAARFGSGSGSGSGRWWAAGPLVGVALVDLEETSGSSSLTPGSDTSSGGAPTGGTAAAAACWASLALRPPAIRPLILMMCCHTNAKRLRIHCIVSWAITGCSLRQFTTSCPHTIEPNLQHSSLYM